jgi:hypothetical protein
VRASSGTGERHSGQWERCAGAGAWQLRRGRAGGGSGRTQCHLRVMAMDERMKVEEAVGPSHRGKIAISIRGSHMSEQ